MQPRLAMASDVVDTVSSQLQGFQSNHQSEELQFRFNQTPSGHTVEQLICRGSRTFNTGRRQRTIPYGTDYLE